MASPTFTVKWYGTEVVAKLAKSLPRKLSSEAARIGVEADRTAPIKSGAMIRSRSSELDGFTVYIVYAAPYALRQHETLWFRHAPGKRAKWLSLTIAEQLSRFDEAMADAVREVTDQP